MGWPDPVKRGPQQSEMCKRGLHVLSGENVVVNSRGSRQCRACLRQKQQEWEEAHHEWRRQYNHDYYARNRERLVEAQRQRRAAKRGDASHGVA